MDTTKIEILIKEHNRLYNGVVDFNKYTWYSITHHSTAIEGGTLTESQVINLLEYGKPATSKPFEHHLMVSDYFRALQHTIEAANEKKTITPNMVKTIAALTMKNTGGIVNAIGGNYDTSLGDFRRGSVRAGNRLFPDYTKVENLVSKLCDTLNNGLKTSKTFEEKCKLAFDAHFELVSIHPFGDGNGRTSRLLMNYIQAYFELPLSIVFKVDRIKYIDALESARRAESKQPFYDFMFQQYFKFLKKELTELKK